MEGLLSTGPTPSSFLTIFKVRTFSSWFVPDKKEVNTKKGEEIKKAHTRTARFEKMAPLY